MTPRTRPATTAARLDPRPPRIATVKPLMARGVPTLYCVYVIGETTQPARAPIPAESTNESVTRFRVGSPHSEAAVRSEAQARICFPVMVQRKKTVTRTTIVAQTPRVQTTWGDMRAPPIESELTSFPVK